MAQHPQDYLGYSHCNTRKIDLRGLGLSESQSSASDDELRHLYRKYLQEHPPNPSAPSDSTSHRTYLLQAAISSLTIGISPPVAFPTETVYGLGADATNHASVKEIFAAKGRPSDNPLIVHVSSRDHLEQVLGGSPETSAIPEVYRSLIKDFWPGPLTVLVPVPDPAHIPHCARFAANVHPGQKTIGFRAPSSIYARFLIAVANRPIAAPSANSSGRPSPTTAQHVLDDLSGKINFVLDGGPCTVGVESTVVDGLCNPPVILRPGGVSRRDLRTWGHKYGNVWAKVENAWEHKQPESRKKRALTPGCAVTRHTIPSDDSKDERSNGVHASLENSSTAPRAPGMKYKHYAPRCPMYLFNIGTDPKGKFHHAENDTMHELTGSRPPETPSSPRSKTTIGILTTLHWQQFPNQPSQELPQIGDHKNDDSQSMDNVRIHTLHTRVRPVRESNQDQTLPGQVHETVYHSIALGSDHNTISQRLFAALRACDDLGCDYIFAEAPGELTGNKGRLRSAGRCEDAEQNQEEDYDVNLEYETVMERMMKAATAVVNS